MYTVQHWYGKAEAQLPTARFAEIIAELKDADSEHPTVSLKHESEWDLSYGKTGRLIFENVETGKKGEERHIVGVTPEVALEFWKKLAKGDLGWLEKQPWKPGYGR